VAIGGSRASTIDRTLAIGFSANSAATAVNRFSIPAANRAPNPASSPATGLAAAILAKAIVPTKEQTSRIGAKANGEVPMRDRRIVRRTRGLLIAHRTRGLLIAHRTRGRRIVPAQPDMQISAVAVGYIAAAVAPWRVAAAVIAVVEVAAAGVPISD
jgi:hypothetical protein